MWVLRSDLEIKEYIAFNEQVSKISIKLNKDVDLVLFGIWLGFDDSKNRAISNAAFLNNLALLENEINTLKAIETPFLLFGDFNADLNLNKRFDKHLKEFLTTNKLMSWEQAFTQSDIDYTYKKGKTKAYIDHIFYSEKTNFIVDYQILNDSEDVSDHRPITCNFDIDEFITVKKHKKAYK